MYGVEIIPQAISDARENAKINGIENAEFFVGKAEEVLPQWYREHEREEESRGDDDRARAEVIVVDPPRKGWDEYQHENILRLQPEKVV